MTVEFPSYFFYGTIYPSLILTGKRIEVYRDSLLIDDKEVAHHDYKEFVWYVPGHGNKYRNFIIRE